MALANLIRLMGAELAAEWHRDDIDLFVKAVCSRLGSAPALACSFDFAEADLQLAKPSIEQVQAQATAAQPARSILQ